MGAEWKGEILERVTVLRTTDFVRVDADRLGQLYAQLGERGAEDVVCRAMEELAARLGQAEQQFRTNDQPGLRKNARSLVAIADQIGMQLLAGVARDVTDCIDTGDMVALGAVLARLVRVGERSLFAVWDLQDLSI